MSYADDVYAASVFYCLTREEQQAVVQTVVRQFSDWKPIGEFANEIVARLERQLDTDWITEYLSYYDKPEEN